MHGDDRLRWTAWCLVAAGLASLAWAALEHLSIATRAYEQRLALDQLLAGTIDAGNVPAPPLPGQPFAEIRVPRIGLSAVVIEGDDDGALAAGVGHLPDTPLPWEAGNSALAGHRDTFFRPLRDVAVGDRIHLRTTHGNFEYVVDETLVVNPEHVWVLDRRASAALTLITCYPFTIVGPAPQRFVVRATRVGQ